MHDEWIKEWFSKPCVHTLKKIYVMPSYLSVLKLQNYSSQCSSCVFFRKIEGKLFWITKVINKASVTNSIMNLSHTLHVIADAKALCNYSLRSGNIQIKSCWGPADSPLSYIKLGKTCFQRFKKYIIRWLKSKLLT